MALGRVALGLRTGAILAAVLGMLIGGCTTLVPSPTLQRPERNAKTTEGVGWIGTVAIADPGMTRRETMSTAFASSIREYVEQARYFSETKMLPGRPSPTDYILDFQFPRYRQTRRLLPYYIPAAFLTATLYIWVGGPIFVDEVDLVGDLTVRRGDGGVVGNSHSEIKNKVRRNLYSRGYMNAGSEKERTELIKTLLDQATTSLGGAE